MFAVVSSGEGGPFRVKWSDKDKPEGWVFLRMEDDIAGATGGIGFEIKDLPEQMQSLMNAAFRAGVASRGDGGDSRIEPTGKEPEQPRSFCVHCGPDRAVDEDGLCLICGVDAIGEWGFRAAAALDAPMPVPTDEQAVSLPWKDCPTCRGRGRVFDFNYPADGVVCPTCVALTAQLADEKAAVEHATHWAELSEAHAGVLREALLYDHLKHDRPQAVSLHMNTEQALSLPASSALIERDRRMRAEAWDEGCKTGHTESILSSGAKTANPYRGEGKP